MEPLRKTALNYGLILGVVLIIITTIFYTIDLSLFTKPWFGIGNMLVIVGFGVAAAIKSKKAEGGFLTFKQAFTAFFITVITGIFMSGIYTILLFNFIDPEAKKTISENVIKMTVELMQKFGTPASVINQTVDDMQTKDSFGVAGQLQGLAFNAVIYAVIGLIVALIVKRERPQTL